MSRTITALYDSRSDAESARQRLSSSANISNVDIHEQGGETGSSGSSSESGEHRSWFEKLFMSDDDRETYGEGLRRGHFLLSAQVDNEDDADRIIDLLEETNAVDVDERSQSWRNEGWQPQSSQTSGMLAGSSAQGFASGSEAGYRDTSGAGGFSGSDNDRFAERGERGLQEEHIPIVQEQLRVGKREVGRGSVRVHSHVQENPVSEQVNLREEHVEIERRPMNETLSAADLNSRGLLQDRDIEMQATGEEAIVDKEAHINEEVVVRKTATQHSENVQDTVRHTEVDVEGDGSDRGAFGFDRDGERSEQSQRSSEYQDDDLGRR